MEYDREKERMRSSKTRSINRQRVGVRGHVFCCFQEGKAPRISNVAWLCEETSGVWTAGRHGLRLRLLDLLASLSSFRQNGSKKKSRTVVQHPTRKITV